MQINALIFMLIFIYYPSVALSKTYYVDFDKGDNKNTGLSKSSAWKNIPGTTIEGSLESFISDTYGQDQIVARKKRIRKGTFIKIKSGTTQSALEGGSLKIDSVFYENATDKDPIIIEKDDTWGVGRATIDGTGSAIKEYGALVSIKEVDYLKLRNITIKGSFFWGVSVSDNATHLTLDGLDVSTSTADGIFFENINLPSYSKIVNSKIHHNERGGIILWSAPAGYFLIENNEVYSNKGKDNFDGIQTGSLSSGSSHVIVRYNRIHDNGEEGSDQIDMGGHKEITHLVMEGNEIYGSVGWPNIKLWGMGGKYLIQRFNKLTNHIIVNYIGKDRTQLRSYNNTLKGGRHFLQYVMNSRYHGIQDQVFKNNLFVNNERNPFNYYYNYKEGNHDQLNVSRRSILLEGNIFKFKKNTEIIWGKKIYPVSSSGYKAWVYEQGQNINGKRISNSDNEIFSQPSSPDFYLVHGSPAIDAGVELTHVTSAPGHGNEFYVFDAKYFFDGYDMVDGDQIRVGGKDPVKITAIDYEKNKITVNSSVSWRTGDSVNLRYSGKSPDVGASEFKESDFKNAVK